VKRAERAGRTAKRARTRAQPAWGTEPAERLPLPTSAERAAMGAEEIPMELAVEKPAE